MACVFHNLPRIKCKQLDVFMNRTFLPAFKINRSTPRALVHGPVQYGGMNIVQHEALQDEWGLHYFVQTLRWNQTPADDILATLDAFQLVSGFVTPLLDYITCGWLQHIRRRLRRIGGRMHVEGAWRPRLQ